MANKNNLEIERRFLLKRDPTSEYIFPSISLIKQFYCTSGSRIREKRKYNGYSLGDPKFIKADKTTISYGVNEEIEKNLTKAEFKKLLLTATSYINKKRFVKRVDGLNWEVDIFTDLSIIIAEVELENIHQKITIPEFVSENLIMEITGMKQFSNKSLSLPYKK